MEQSDSHRLGTDTTESVLGRYPELRDAALQMVNQAKVTVDILSRDLDPNLYDNPEFASALGQFVTGDSRRTRVRILVSESAKTVQRGHRLIDLAQRLPSFITIRVPDPEYPAITQAALIVDTTGYIHRELADRPEARVCFAAPSFARDLTRTFDDIWAHSTVDAQTRRLGL